MNHKFFMLALSLLVSCSEPVSESTFEADLSQHESYKPDTRFKRIYDNQNIDFDFTAHRILFDNQKLIEARCTLYNRNPDTAFFYSNTCHLVDHLLRYDESKFTLYHQYACNASFPIFFPLPPWEPFCFEIKFEEESLQTEIQLGFYFCRVPWQVLWEPKEALTSNPDLPRNSTPFDRIDYDSMVLIPENLIMAPAVKPIR